jgi:hypothetical protein
MPVKTLPLKLMRQKPPKKLPTGEPALMLQEEQPPTEAVWKTMMKKKRLEPMKSTTTSEPYRYSHDIPTFKRKVKD